MRSNRSARGIFENVWIFFSTPTRELFTRFPFARRRILRIRELRVSYFPGDRFFGLEIRPVIYVRTVVGNAKAYYRITVTHSLHEKPTHKRNTSKYQIDRRPFSPAIAGTRRKIVRCRPRYYSVFPSCRVCQFSLATRAFPV